jgi:hypothetical protein
MTRRLLWLLPLFGLLFTQNLNAVPPERTPDPTQAQAQAQAQEIVKLLGAQISPALPAPLRLVPRPTNLTTCIPEPVCAVDSDCADFCGDWTPHCTWIRCPNRILACVCTQP